MRFSPRLGGLAIISWDHAPARHQLPTGRATKARSRSQQSIHTHRLRSFFSFTPFNLFRIPDHDSVTTLIELNLLPEGAKDQLGFASPLRPTVLFRPPPTVFPSPHVSRLDILRDQPG